MRTRGASNRNYTYVDLNLLAHIDDANPRMLWLVDGLVMSFVVPDTTNIVQHCLVWIPSFVLGRLDGGKRGRSQVLAYIRGRYFNASNVGHHDLLVCTGGFCDTVRPLRGENTRLTDRGK
jgi:hypothetical protein